MGHASPNACPHVSQEAASGGLTRPQAGHSIDAKPLSSWLWPRGGYRLDGVLGRMKRTDLDSRHAVHHNGATMCRFSGALGLRGLLSYRTRKGTSRVGWPAHPNSTVVRRTMPRSVPICRAIDNPTPKPAYHLASIHGGRRIVPTQVPVLGQCYLEGATVKSMFSYLLYYQAA